MKMSNVARLSGGNRAQAQLQRVLYMRRIVCEMAQVDIRYKPVAGTQGGIAQ